MRGMPTLTRARLAGESVHDLKGIEVPQLTVQQGQGFCGNARILDVLNGTDGPMGGGRVREWQITQKRRQ
jgi:hypothetical protein